MGERIAGLRRLLRVRRSAREQAIRDVEEEVRFHLEEEYPESNATRGVFVEPVFDVMFGDVRPALLILLSAVGLLLLIAYVNVASLFLARGMARARDVAVRAALGAGSGRLARQFVVESLLVTLAAAALGVLVARLGLNGLLALLPAELPRAGAVSVDVRVLGVTAANSVSVSRSELNGAMCCEWSSVRACASWPSASSSDSLELRSDRDS